MGPAICVVRNAAKIPGKTVYGSGAYTDLLASEETAAKPIVAGVWNLQDVRQPSEAQEGEWDEVKYITEGSITLRDEHTGDTHTAEAGDFLWLPKGSKCTILRSFNLTTVYFEQRHADWPAETKISEGQLQTRLEELKRWFTDANPKSAHEAKEAATVLPGGNTRTVLFSTPFPLAMESGKDALVVSKDGHEYIDFVSEFTAGMYGHSHPKIHEAVQNALRTGMSLGSTIGKEAEMGKLIQKRFPDMELMRFTNSGTEANTLALVAALAYTGQKEVLVFERGYHGSTLSFPPGKSPPTNLPYQFLRGKLNDIENTRQLLHHGIGAILVEPLQCAGGVITATREFLHFLRNAATTLGAVLIFDEVVTSRLHYHGLQHHFGVKPDMTTLGKYLGGGFSFGCFGGKRDIMRQFDPTSPNFLAHSGTFNNNVFTMTAGIAGLKLLTASEIERVNVLGNRMRTNVNNLAKEKNFGHHFEVVGFGSVNGLRFTSDIGETLREVFYFELLQRGIVVGRRGFIVLNLCHTDAHVDALVQAVAEILELLTKDASE